MLWPWLWRGKVIPLLDSTYSTSYRCIVKLSRYLLWHFISLSAFAKIWHLVTMATHFPLLSYHVDTSNWTFQEAQDVGFTKMYGRNCHPEWYQYPNFQGQAHGPTDFFIVFAVIITPIVHQSHHPYVSHSSTSHWELGWLLDCFRISSAYCPFVVLLPIIFSLMSYSRQSWVLTGFRACI